VPALPRASSLLLQHAFGATDLDALSQCYEHAAVFVKMSESRKTIYKAKTFRAFLQVWEDKVRTGFPFMNDCCLTLPVPKQKSKPWVGKNGWPVTISRLQKSSGNSGSGDDNSGDDSDDDQDVDQGRADPGSSTASKSASPNGAKKRAAEADEGGSPKKKRAPVKNDDGSPPKTKKKRDTIKKNGGIKRRPTVRRSMRSFLLIPPSPPPFAALMSGVVPCRSSRATARTIESSHHRLVKWIPHTLS
jgi:hypothetical protein